MVKVRAIKVTGHLELTKNTIKLLASMELPVKKRNTTSTKTPMLMTLIRKFTVRNSASSPWSYS